MTLMTSEPSAIQSALTSAFTSISADLQSTATSVAPIALSIIGVSIVIIFGIRMYKKITNKA